jgi:hypothetical protein
MSALEDKFKDLSEKLQASTAKTEVSDQVYV